MADALVRSPTKLALPFGIGQQKPHHYREMVRVFWDNRRHPLYAMRVLRDGVCDGCALGTSGLHDWTLDGVHLCLVRLNLLRLNTLDAMPEGELADAAALRSLRTKPLLDRGRLAHPMRRRRGERGFTRVSWDEALAEIGARLGAADPDRVACYLTSRGIGNEVYFAVQKAMRFLGSPHVDNAARLCHSPSTAAMKRVLGVAASTCSYRDWYGTDLVVFLGSNPANDQPVALKYLAEAKKLGTRVLMREHTARAGPAALLHPVERGLGAVRHADRRPQLPALERRRPGVPLRGAKAADRALRAIDRAFIDAHTQRLRPHTSATCERYALDELIARAGCDARRRRGLRRRAREGAPRHLRLEHGPHTARIRHPDGRGAVLPRRCRGASSAASAAA